MTLLWTQAGPYRRAGYENDSDLEAAILQVQRELFRPPQATADYPSRRTRAKMCAVITFRTPPPHISPAIHCSRCSLWPDALQVGRLTAAAPDGRMRRERP